MELATDSSPSESTSDSAPNLAEGKAVSTATSEEDIQSSSEQENAEEHKATSNIVDDLKGFFSRPLLSKKKTDELKTLVNEADKIHARLDDTEESVRNLVKSASALDKKIARELTRVFNHIRKSQVEQEAAIEGHIERLRSSLASQEAHLQQLQKIILNKVSDAAGQVSGVNSTITGIRDYLSDNNKMLQRLQEGYDFQILKNFVRQITRSISSLDTQITRMTDDEARQELEDARDDLIELLERNNLVQIVPDIDAGYEGMQKYAEVLQEKVETVVLELDGHIASVERIGYKYEFNDGQERIIQPAQVKLYEYNKKGINHG